MQLPTFRISRVLFALSLSHNDTALLLRSTAKISPPYASLHLTFIVEPALKGTGLLLAVGDRENNNAMTIGWGSLGNVWGKIGENTVTVYVAEGRYTYEFMEKYDYFTVMAFDEDQKDILRYMGTHSGRDGDKAQALGLHTLYTENGTPYYEEASLVLECRTIYKAPFDKEGMCDAARNFYADFSAGVHHLYIGNVVSALIKE